MAKTYLALIAALALGGLSGCGPRGGEKAGQEGPVARIDNEGEAAGSRSPEGEQRGAVPGPAQGVGAEESALGRDPMPPPSPGTAETTR